MSILGAKRLKWLNWKVNCTVSSASLNPHKYSETVSPGTAYIIYVKLTRPSQAYLLLLKQAPITHKLSKQIFTDTTSIKICYCPLHCNRGSFMSSSFTNSSSVPVILKQTKKQRSMGLHLQTLYNDWPVGESPHRWD